MIALIPLALLLAFPLCAQAAPAPIVFDFEDGLQGWELHGSATRVQTLILGGHWAIFGDGLAEVGAAISIDINLTDIASVSVEQFWAGDPSMQAFGQTFLTLAVSTPSGVIAGSLLPFAGTNPGTRTADLSDIEGVHTLHFLWFRSIDFPVSCFPSTCPPPPPDDLLGFIDNITFHPVPESSSWLYLSLGIAGAVMIRRKLASRA